MAEEFKGYILVKAYGSVSVKNCTIGAASRDLDTRF